MKHIISRKITTKSFFQLVHFVINFKIRNNILDLQNNYEEVFVILIFFDF